MPIHQQEDAMKKLRLSIEDLSVESFRVQSVEKKDTGTVMAHAKYSGSCPEVCDGGGGGGTYVTDCNDSVHYSCYHSCYIYGSCDTTCP
jgi:hypothetical protein